MGDAAKADEGERQGELLGGKYLLEDCLGIGGMGEVYRATNVSLGRKVAVKVLNREHTGNEDDVMRFLREARAAAAVRHPNVVDVLDVAREDDGTPFIVQELLSGQDLEQHLDASGGTMTPDEALEIMIPVADAVAAAHTRDVVHRDLKPANIFLAREGSKIVPKVLDFGACLYKTVGALSAKEQRMLIGTPHYMAPEQISTAMDVDARADVWAMGVIFYEMLVGETPFEADEASMVLKLVRTHQVPPLRKKVRGVPESIEQLVARCLDRDRKRRFADAAAMRDELERIRADLRGSARRRVDTMSEADLVLPEDDGRASASRPRDGRTEDPAPLVLKGGKRPTKRRGSSLLTLGEPEDGFSLEIDAPGSAQRRVDAAPAAPKRERTAADVIREAEEASLAAASVSSAKLRATPRAVPDLRTPREFAPPAAPLSGGVPSSPSKELGAPRDLELSDPREAELALDLDDPAPRANHELAPDSALPPVLDPRAAAPSGGDGDGASSAKPHSDGRPAAPRSSQEPPLSPPLHPLQTPGSAHVPASARGPASARLSAAPPASARDVDPPTGLKGNARLTFGAGIVAPAVIAFLALRLAPVIDAPLGHAMRGDTPLGSGALAVLTLVGAAVLAARALGASRTRGNLLATVGAVLLGIVMIIVTFSASETAELGVPPAAGGIVAYLAPLVPLGLGLSSFSRARELWSSPYDRRDAVKLLALTSFLLFAVLELGPVGAVRAAAARPLAGAQSEQGAQDAPH